METPPEERPRWTVQQEDDTRKGFWYLHDDRRWDDRFVLPGHPKESLEYAASVLNAGGLDEDDFASLSDLEHVLESEFILRVQCVRCLSLHFAGESDPAGRCRECQP